MSEFKQITIEHGGVVYAVQFQGRDPQNVMSVYRRGMDYGSTRRVFWTRFQKPSRLTQFLLKEAAKKVGS